MGIDFQRDIKLSLLASIKTSCVLIASNVVRSSESERTVIKDVSSQFIVQDFQFNGSTILSLSDIYMAMLERAKTVNRSYCIAVLDGVAELDRCILMLARVLHNVVIVIHDANNIEPKLLRSLQKLCLALDYHSCVDFRLVLIGDETLISSSQVAKARFDYLNFHFEGFSDLHANEMHRVVSVEKMIERRSIKQYFCEYTKLLENTPKLKRFLMV